MNIPNDYQIIAMAMALLPLPIKKNNSVHKIRMRFPFALHIPERVCLFSEIDVSFKTVDTNGELSWTPVCIRVAETTGEDEMTNYIAANMRYANGLA